MEWKDGTTSWLPLKAPKESNSVEIANYAIANKIDTEPAFDWWSKDLLHKQRRLIKLSQKRSIQTGFKFGLPLPLTVAEALEGAKYILMELFAKMFVYCLTHEIEFYKDVSFASQKLQEELSKPLSSNYDKILDTLNRVEMNKYLQSIGIITDHIENMLLTQKKENEQIELKKKYAPEIKKYLFGIWSKESVYKSLNNTITECINKYNCIYELLSICVLFFFSSCV